MNEPQLEAALSGIDGRLLPGEAYWLHQKVLALPEGANVLEIGCFRGFSSCAMATACGGTKTIHVVEYYQPCIDTSEEHWIRLGVRGRVRAVCADSKDLLEVWSKAGWPKMDFAFIDGDHGGVAPLRDFINVLYLTNPGGRIAMHDVSDDWPDVKSAWHNHAARILQNVDGCGIIMSGTA